MLNIHLMCGVTCLCITFYYKQLASTQVPWQNKLWKGQQWITKAENMQQMSRKHVGRQALRQSQLYIWYFNMFFLIVYGKKRMEVLI